MIENNIAKSIIDLSTKKYFVKLFESNRTLNRFKEMLKIYPIDFMEKYNGNNIIAETIIRENILNKIFSDLYEFF